MQDRKTRRPAGHRPLTARQVVASTLLGVDPPRLPSSHLVRAGELFGINEGTTRVAVSRMLAAGELEADDGGYRLAGPLLLDRQARQAEGRHPELLAWSGAWSLHVVRTGSRSAAARSDLRAATRALHLAELREGVWLRPANLDPDRFPTARAVVEAQCDAFVGHPELDGTGPATDLARSLWDLDGWATDARRLTLDMHDRGGALDAGDSDELRRAWELSAAVLRHLLADPLLPAELLADDWPGRDLRAAYDDYDRAFKARWRREVT
jgi:phenylacetic acid degradation operon negative regulatory protein